MTAITRARAGAGRRFFSLAITATLNPAAYSYTSGDRIDSHPDFATLDAAGNYSSTTSGTIQSVEDVPRSRKLVSLRVEFGDHQRTILAGMKQERDVASEVVGMQALFVVNLPPRPMAGQVSEGMLFDIGYEDGICPVLAIPEKPVPDGSRAE